MGHRQSLSNSTNQTQDSSLKEKNVYIAEECYSLMSSNSIKSIKCGIEETGEFYVGILLRFVFPAHLGCFFTDC